MRIFATFNLYSSRKKSLCVQHYRCFSCATVFTRDLPYGRYVIRRTDLVFQELMRGRRHYSPGAARDTKRCARKIYVPWNALLIVLICALFQS